jgi:hypothetical protein
MLTEEQKNVILSQSKGTWQLSVTKNLINDLQVPNPIKNLKGNAKNYNDLYRKSLLNLFTRITSKGFKINKTMGKLGGDYGSVYTLEL